MVDNSPDRRFSKPPQGGSSGGGGGSSSGSKHRSAGGGSGAKPVRMDMRDPPSRGSGGRPKRGSREAPGTPGSTSSAEGGGGSPAKTSYSAMLDDSKDEARRKSQRQSKPGIVPRMTKTQELRLKQVGGEVGGGGGCRLYSMIVEGIDRVEDGWGWFVVD